MQFIIYAKIVVVFPKGIKWLMYYSVMYVTPFSHCSDYLTWALWAYGELLLSLCLLSVTCLHQKTLKRSQLRSNHHIICIFWLWVIWGQELNYFWQINKKTLSTHYRSESLRTCMSVIIKSKTCFPFELAMSVLKFKSGLSRFKNICISVCLYKILVELDSVSCFVIDRGTKTSNHWYLHSMSLSIKTSGKFDSRSCRVKTRSPWQTNVSYSRSHCYCQIFFK